MALDLAWSTILGALYALFVNYLFGSIELTAVGLLIIISAIMYRMNVSADGWVFGLGGYGIVMGFTFIPNFAIASLTAIIIGVLMYVLLKRFSR